MAKLKKLLEAAFQNKPQINKYEVVEGVRSLCHAARCECEQGRRRVSSSSARAAPSSPPSAWAS